MARQAQFEPGPRSDGYTFEDMNAMSRNQRRQLDLPSSEIGMRMATMGGPVPAPADRYLDAALARTAARDAAQMASTADAQTMGDQPMMPPDTPQGWTIGDTAAGKAAGDFLGAGAAGVSRGAASLVDLPANMLDAGNRGAASLVGMVSPTTGQLMRDNPPFASVFQPGLARGAMETVTGGASEYKGQSVPAQYAGTVGEFLGGGANPKAALAAGLGSEFAGQMTEGSEWEPVARLVGGLTGALAGAGIQGLVDAAKRNKGIRAYIAAAPETEAMEQQAGKLYDAARNNGVVATPQQTATMRDGMVDILKAESIITPKGNMAGSYPRITDTMQLIDDWVGSPMSPSQMLQVRKSFSKAAQSADPAEARLGTLLIRHFDTFTDPLAPEIAKANSIWRAMSQGELIEKTIELAKLRSSQFSGSGFENALRTEFRALDRQIVKGTLKASPDEAALIQRIGRGGVVENLARDIGKAAPRGIVSVGVGGGMPYMIGNSIGGPLVGAMAGATTMAAGEIGRRAATAMQTKNAELLSALARMGGKLPANIMQRGQGINVPGILPGLMAQ
jgi:hypothetical protein